MSNFYKGGVLLAALTMGLAACGGGSMSPKEASAAQTNPGSPQSALGNNTSAADSFVTQQNGNVGAGNVSKVSIRSALNISSSTPIWAHLMVWFGQPNHMNVGYDSADPHQVHKQLDDMQSRGIQGAIIDWYGTDPSHAHEDSAATVVMQDAQGRGGFQFPLWKMPEAGLKCAPSSPVVTSPSRS
ncbi:MAG TPA: hypothetical protein VGR48_04945 [Terriglobales bacterium]|nr:hypothetical protein [Terriglobales bacterium]